MKTTTATILLLVSLVAPAIAQVPSHFHPINLLDAVVLRKPEQQDLIERDIARQLAASLVPTVKDAVNLSDEVWRKAGIGRDAREAVEVTGLYMLGRDVPGFAAKGELFWEVKGAITLQVTRAVWVSTTTRTVKEIIPISN